MPDGAGVLLAQVAFWYLLISLVTLGVYVKDKRAAKTGRRRTQETTLHLLSLAGGWPGAFIGMGFVRHKSQKLAFKWMLGLTAVINVGALLWLL